MATQVQRRKGTTVQHSTFTGASAELTVDTTKNTVVVHDGATAGGIPLAKESGSALSPSSLSLPNGTANAVPYLNGSKVLTSGSALTFDGTNLGVGTSALSGGKFSTLADLTAVNGLVVRDSATTYANNDNYVLLQNSTGGLVGSLTHPAANSLGIWSQDDIRFFLTGAATEQMRLTSTGLGIGTSSPSQKLDVNGSAVFGSGAGNIAINLNGANTGTGNGSYIGLKNGGTLVGGIGGYSALFGGAYSDDLGIYFQSGKALKISDAGSSSLTFQSGNLGLGVTPSAWGAGYVAAQIGSASIFSQAGGSGGYYIGNGYFNGSAYVYRNTAPATRYEMVSGQHAWSYAASGTAGAAITFTQAMTLDASGNLGVGTTSPIPSARLQVKTATNINLAIQTGTADATGVKLNAFNDAASVNIPLELNGSVLLLKTGETERARIDSSGNLGIGATSPAAKLQISSGSGGDTTGLRITRTDAGGGDFRIWATGNANGEGGGKLIFGNASNLMALDGSGNLLVGTTSYFGGTARLSITATAAAQNVLQTRPTTNITYYPGIFENSSGTTVGYIQSTNTATSYVTSSDYRLKNSIAPMTGALAKVLALKPVTYKWNVDGSAGEGFIAHELAEVCPAAVTGEKDAVDADGNPKYQGIDVSFLVGTLTAAIQELKAEFDAYKASHP